MSQHTSPESTLSLDATIRWVRQVYLETPATTTPSETDRLPELKRPYNEKILTEKECESEKKKVLDSTDN